MTTARTNPLQTGKKQKSQTNASRRFVTIRWTLPIYIVAPLISGIALTGWLSFRSGQTAVETLIDTISTEVAANIEKQIKSYLNEPAFVSAAISAEVTGDNLTTDDVRVLGNSLWQLTQSELLANNLYYGNEAGEFVYSGNINGEARLEFVDKTTDFNRVSYRVDAAGNLGESRTLDSYDPRTRPWYQPAAAEKMPVWSPVYIDPFRDELTLTRATPILDEANQLRGVFGSDIYLNELGELMRDLAISPNGRAFIIETSGELIASSANEIPFIEQDGSKLRMPATNSRDPLIRETAIQLQEKVANLTNLDERKIIEFKLEGETQLAYIHDLQDIGVDWFIGIVIPQRDYMESINENAKRTIIIGLIITATASLIALAAALHIVHPIRKLNKTAYDIQNDRFDPDTLNGVITRFDEFSGLAQLFNDMATVVASREQSLAEQVQALKSEIDQNGGSHGDRQKLERLLARSQRLRARYRHK